MESFENRKEVLLIFGQNIKRSREKQNMDISELARRVHYDRNCLSRLEYGEQNISYKTAIKLAKGLNVPFPALFSRNFLLKEADEFCEDDFLMVFIENIKRELSAKGMSQTRIYIEGGIQEAVISRFLNGRTNNPTLMTLSKIAMAITDGDVVRLFSRKDNNKGDGR